jgi:hypothetical protein
VGVEPLAFVDNDPRLWGSFVDGMRVLSPFEAMSRWSANVAFVVTIFRGTPVRLQLEEAGCECVIPWPYLYWKYHEAFLPYGGVSRPEVTLDCSKEVRAAYDIWADDASRAVFLSQLAWRFTLDNAVLPTPSPVQDTYFPPDLLTCRDELFVDVRRLRCI